MCTLIVATGLWPEAPLVVAANRDERLGRPAEPPALRPGGIVAPRDLQEGGTWLGINGAGLFVGITNRYGRPRAPERRSRGALVLEALAAPTAAAALAWAGALSGTAYNGFHLVLADRSGAALVIGDGERIEARRLEPGVHVVTERSFGAGETRRPAYVQARMAALVAAGPPPEKALAELLRTHGPEPLESVCVHALALDYGTRSSTILRLGADAAAVRFLHAEGPPCQNEYCDLSALVREAVERWVT